MNEIKFGVKASQEHEDSYNIIQIGKKNNWGEDYCVEVGLSYAEARRRCNTMNGINKKEY